MRLNRKHLFSYLMGTVTFCSLMILIFLTSIAFAASGGQESQDISQSLVLSDLHNSGPIVSNEVCLECHGKPGLSITLTNGDILDLYVNPDNYADSVHGKNGYACVQCHTDLGNYPHLRA